MVNVTARRHPKHKHKRIVATLCLLALLAGGIAVGYFLAPKATGAPSSTLPLQPAQTELDRELAPLLAANPGKTGALLLSDGLDAFAARAIAARKAGRSLDLQYYIWHDDLTGRLLAREVHAAAERGVRVRMLLDDLNAVGLDPRLMALDAHPNIELRLYNPLRSREASLDRALEMVQRVASINHRMHNKAWIADGRVAIIGGRNIGEEYFAADEEVNFRDLDLLLFGPAVAQASAIFDAFWNSPAVVPIAALNRKSGDQLRRLLDRTDDDALDAEARPYLERVARADGVRAYQAQVLQPVWTDQVEIVSDPPLKGRGARKGWIVTRLVDVLRSARTQALVISPYFVPGDTAVAAMSHLVEQGVQVGVVTNSLAANDVPAVHGGYAAYRQPLLAAGVQLYETRLHGRPQAAGRIGSSGASLHTKAFVVDGRRGFVGSFNLDPRSADLNTEMGVLFDDPALGAAVRDEYLWLAEPEHSYWVYLSKEGDLRWLDWSRVPPEPHHTEPDASLGRRVLAKVLGWLPIESQL